MCMLHQKAVLDVYLTYKNNVLKYQAILVYTYFSVFLLKKLQVVKNIGEGGCPKLGLLYESLKYKLQASFYRIQKYRLIFEIFDFL